MGQAKHVSNNLRYAFDAPIKLIEYRPNGLDIMIYSGMLGIVIVILIFILAYKDGHFALSLTMGRVLCSIPLIVLAVFVYSLLKELWIYPRKLGEKTTWTIDEFMNLTKKDRHQTELIITRVLESSFVVADECIIRDEP